MVTSLADLNQVNNKLIILVPSKKGDGYRVQFEGTYDVAKAMKNVSNKVFFPYYKTGSTNIPLGLTNKHKTNSVLQGHVLSDDKMLAAGFDVSPIFRKKRANAKEYFCYKKLVYPGIKDPDLQMLVTVYKDSQDVNVKILDGMGTIYDYRDIFNSSAGENKTAMMTNMQVEFWLTYFQDKGIISGYSCGDFVC